MSAPEPKVLISPESTFCPRHLAPFRERWPAGYPTAAVCLVYQGCQRPEIIAAAGGDIELLTPVLLTFGPLCCLLGDELTAEITKAALSDDSEDWKRIIEKYGPPAPRRKPWERKR